jgi:hypothetical protein
MRKGIDSSLLLGSLLVFLLAVFGYLQFGYVAFALGLLPIISYFLFLYFNKPLLINIVNLVVSIILSIQSFNSDSAMVDKKASCIGPCIGSNLPLLSIRFFSILVVFIATSLFIRRVIEKK